MAKKETYLKLGEKSPAFADINSGVILSGKKVIKVTNFQKNASKVAKAILGGHLTIADEDEYEAWKEFEAESKTIPQAGNVRNKLADLEAENEELRKKLADLDPEEEEITFSKMNSNALVKYYKDEFEVTEEDVEKFKALGLEEKRKFLDDLES